MFQSFKSLFYENPYQKIFEQASVDANQTTLNMCLVSDLQRHLKNPAMKQKFLQQLFKGLQSSKWVKRLKYLMTVHYLIIQTSDSDLVQGFLRACENNRYKQPPRQQAAITDVKVWIENCVITHYISYILRLCAHLQFFQECRKNEPLTSNFAELIVGGFKALNLTNFILETKVNFNKLGRYYQELRVVLDLFRMYLRDTNILYSRLKQIIEVLLNSPTTIEKTQLSHAFAFLNETLKTSDQLYQFYYNRYYYKAMRDFSYPHFYKLDYRRYKSFVKHLKSQIPVKEFSDLELYFSAHKRQQLFMNKTLMTLNPHEEDFCQQIQKTLMDWEMSKNQCSFGEQMEFAVTEGNEEDEKNDKAAH